MTHTHTQKAWPVANNKTCLGSPRPWLIPVSGLFSVNCSQSPSETFAASELKASGAAAGDWGTGRVGSELGEVLFNSWLHCSFPGQVWCL